MDVVSALAVVSAIVDAAGEVVFAKESSSPGTSRSARILCSSKRGGVHDGFECGSGGCDQDRLK